MVKRRIDFLDGLRGIAIVGVLIFHAYVSAPQYLPFGDRFGFVPLRLGWVGVELFFMISGFVILMTLENCDGLLDFAKRRWLRLFPAMLIASVLIVAFDRLTGLGPNAGRSLADIIPGLLFLSPALIHAITRLPLESLDTPFWSLYVEVVFYVCFSVTYFLFGRRVAIISIFSLAMISYLANVLAAFGIGGQPFDKMAQATNWLGFTEFAWFAAGALFYRYYVTDRGTLLYGAIVVAVVAALTSENFKFDLADRLGLLAVVAVFTAAVCSEVAHRILSNRTLVFFGFVSYPLYLIHNNILVGLEGAIAKQMPEALSTASPILPAALIVGASWLIATYAEPPMRVALRRLLQPDRIVVVRRGI